MFELLEFLVITGAGTLQQAFLSILPVTGNVATVGLDPSGAV